MHRSLFGELNNAPVTHEVQQVYTKKANGKQAVSSGMPVAGSSSWNQVNKANGVQAAKDLPPSQKYGPSN